MDGWNALHACGKCRSVFYVLGRAILSPFGVGPVYVQVREPQEEGRILEQTESRGRQIFGDRKGMMMYNTRVGE